MPKWTGWGRRRSTFFAKGHASKFTWLEGSVRRNGEDAVDVPAKVWRRLPREVYSIAQTEFPSTPCILRPADSAVDPWDDASLDIQTENGGRVETGELQPSIQKSYHKAPGSEAKESETFTRLQGNRVVNMTKLSEMFNIVYRKHFEESENCAGKFIFPASDESLWGLGTTVGVTCSLCHYKDQFKLYEETVCAPHSQKGRKAAKINLQLGAFLTKSNTPYTDIRFLFATIDVAPPSEHCITKNVDNLSQQWPAINDRKMKQNCEVVKNLLKHQNLKQIKPITCMSDTVYNNPPKGRAMNQPGTQCSIPIVECETVKKMVLGISTLNRLCVSGAKCNLSHPGCTANLAPETSMGSAESKLLLNNVKQLQEKDIVVGAIVEDGVDLKKSKDLGIEKELCHVHMARCQRRRVHRINFSSETVGRTTRGAQMHFKNLVGNAISKRCTQEIKLTRKKFPLDDSKFMKKISEAKDNILDCLSGKHNKCKKFSSVCSGEGDKKILNSTPLKRPLCLDEKEKISLQAVINFRLNAPMAYRQRNFWNTNRVESLHLRTLKLCPKFKTYKKNYTNRNHSAMHSDSVGAGISILTLLRQNKTMPATNKYFKKIHNKCVYHSLRQKGEDFRRRRKYLSVQKARLKRLQCLSAHSSNMDVPIDHTYS